MSASVDVVVVGGGVIGSSIAYHLSCRGMRTLVIEREGAGGRATRASAGMLAAQEEAGEDESFLRFSLDSREMFKTLVPEVMGVSGIDPDFSVTGIARAALDADEAGSLRAKAADQSARGWPTRWFSSQEAGDFWPGFQAPFGAFLAPDDGLINPVLWSRSLLEAARRRGARVMEFAPTVSLLTDGHRVTGVRTDRGSILADHVVLAAGSWTPHLLEELSTPLPLFPVKGQVLVLAGHAGKWKTPIYAGSGYMVPRADGRILVGATAERVGFDDRPTLDAQRRLADWVSRWVPILSDCPVVGLQAGLRPGSIDGKPVIGPVPGWSGVSVACGHFRNGILLSPITGFLVAEALASGRWPAASTAYSPQRFPRPEARTV